jgi:hypothetical protein
MLHAKSKVQNVENIFLLYKFIKYEIIQQLIVLK